MSIRHAVGVTAAVTLWLTLAALASMTQHHESGAAFLPVSHEANRSFRPGTAHPPAMPTAVAPADEADPEEEDVKLTLDRIFPKKSFFGPSASRVSFSHDGRFAAFLYRSYAERRHGSDLYVHDSETGQIRRITSVGRMAEHQADVREVRDDREKQAKKAGITLQSLADEQAARLGWPASSPLGTWKGDASTDGGPIDEGQATLHLTRGKKDTFEGYIRIGLVKLALTGAKFDAETGALTATIDDKTLSVEGSLDAAAEEGFAAISGTLTLEEPAQTVTFTLTPGDEAAEDSDDEPRGVIGSIGERLTLGDVVTDADAEINDEKNGKAPDKRAPRYGGVQGFEWSESSNEMLLLSGGDIYRLSFDAEKWAEPVGPPAGDDEDAAGKPVTPYRGDLERLTFTRERESDVQYLPDGSGYTYLRDGALLRVSFGDHRIIQLDPELKDGERMVGYQLSPDQKRLVFLANRGDSYWGRGTSVTIVNYRERFARANQVTRHMPDSPWPDAFTSVYLYDLDGYETEEGTLERVFTKRLTGPRDILRMPEWSPDSTRITFAAYEQSTGLVKVLEAGFVEESDDADADDAKESPDAEDDADGDSNGDDEDTDSDKDTEGETKAAKTDEDADTDEDKPEFEIENAKVVYEFYHFGGPNTPGMIQPQYLPDSRRMAFITELSGFRQLHLLDPRYQQLTQLTYGQFEVYPFDISDDHSTIFATATKDDPNQGHVYAVNLETGDMSRLTSVDGDYSSVAVRDDGSLLLASHIDFGSPRELVAVTPAEGTTTPLTDSHPEEAHTLTAASPEYFTYENRHGQTIHGHMFKPKDFSPDDERPLLIYVYGGPLGERKMATRGAFAAPSYFFARYMSEVHGYVTATIDPRGASGYGAVFEKANFEQVGKPQTEDLVDGARWLVKQGGIDEKKMGLHGWSFGGFQTQMVMYTEPDVFAVGMAGAGPTEWFNYNSWYTTGTIGPHKPGQLNLKDQSLLPLAKNITGRLLLVHGMEDSNVLYQDTVNVYRELLKADKEVNVELFLDPTGGHGLGGDVKTIGRYRKYEDFLLRYLGEGKPAKADEPEQADNAEEAAEVSADESVEEGATDEDADTDSTDESDKGDTDDVNEDEQENDDGAERSQDAVNTLQTQTARP